MNTIQKISIVVLVMFLSIIGTSSAGIVGGGPWFPTWWLGEWGPLPGPAYSHCDGDPNKICIKKGRVTVTDGITNTDYDFAWIPDANLVYDDISGCSVYNIDVMTNACDVQINTTSNTVTFTATSLQDIIDYYNNK